MGAGCSVTGWSAVGSATANSALAGVLAGFMIAAIILVLSIPSDNIKAGYVRGLSLLFAAFLALGVDSFLFGLVTGDDTTNNAFSGCRRAWTEAMLGAGLLAVGTVAIIAGFVYLFTAYFTKSQAGNAQAGNDELKKSVDMLRTLCNIVRVGVGFTVVAALGMTSKSYLHAIYGGSVPPWGRVLIWEYLIQGVILVTYTGAGLLRSANNGVTSLVRANSNPGLLRWLKAGIYSSVVYTVLSVLAGAAAAASPASFWYPIHPAAQAAIIATVTWVSLISLLPLWLLLFVAVPPFGLPDLPPDSKGTTRHSLPVLTRHRNQ